MNKQTKIIITIVVVVISIILIIVFWKKISGLFKKKTDSTTTTTSASGNSIDGVTVSITQDTDTILKKGNSGQMVTVLQSMLNAVLIDQKKKVTDFSGDCNESYLDDDGLLTIDGEFGNCTEQALYGLASVKQISVEGLANKFDDLFNAVPETVNEVLTAINPNDSYSLIDDLTNWFDDSFSWFTDIMTG